MDELSLRYLCSHRMIGKVDGHPKGFDCKIRAQKKGHSKPWNNKQRVPRRAANWQDKVTSFNWLHGSKGAHIGVCGSTGGLKDPSQATLVQAHEKACRGNYLFLIVLFSKLYLVNLVILVRLFYLINLFVGFVQVLLFM